MSILKKWTVFCIFPFLLVAAAAGCSQPSSAAAGTVGSAGQPSKIKVTIYESPG